MQLKQLFHMLRAAAPDEPAPKAAPKGSGATFASVLAGTLDADALREAPPAVREALHGMIRQATDPAAKGRPAQLPSDLPDALRHSLEALGRGPQPNAAADGPVDETPDADAPAPDTPRLVLKADGTVHLQLPGNPTATGTDGQAPAAGPAPGDAPRYTQPGGPQAHEPGRPADHRVRHPKAPTTAQPGQQPTSAAERSAADAPGPQPAQPSDGPEATPDAARKAERPAPPALTTTPTATPTSAALTAAVEEAITRLAAQGPATDGETAAEGTKTQPAGGEGAARGGAVRTDSGTQEAGTQEAGTQEAGTQEAGTQEAGTQEAGTREAGTQEAGTREAGTREAGTREAGTGETKTRKAAHRLAPGAAAERTSAQQPVSPAATPPTASTEPTASTAAPADAMPVLQASDGTAAAGDTPAQHSTPQPTAGTPHPMGRPTPGAADGVEEAHALDTRPERTPGSQAATAGEGEDAGDPLRARRAPAAEPRPANPPAPHTPPPDPHRLVPRAPTPSDAPLGEALPDEASADVRLGAGAQARAEQTATARTDGGGLALRMDGDAPLQPRPTAPALATADAAPASSASADGGTADQGTDSDPQQRHRDAQALQQALRHARQNGPAPPPALALPSAEFSPSLSDALANLSSDTPTVTTTKDVDGEAQLLRHALEGVLSEVKPSRTTPARATAAPGASQANMNAWMKTLLNQPARAFALNNGWQVLQVQLEDGQGSLTVSARRDDDRMAVSVGFTDAALRGQAAVQAGRIQDALQAQYETQVDFSLHDDTQGQSSHDRSTSGRLSPSLGGADIEPDAASSAASSSARAALLGANHEWIA